MVFLWFSHGFPMVFPHFPSPTEGASSACRSASAAFAAAEASEASKASARRKSSASDGGDFSGEKSSNFTTSYSYRINKTMVTMVILKLLEIIMVIGDYPIIK